MRKTLSILSMLLVLCVLAYGQAKTVTGAITDDKGNPVPFASILIKGTNSGVSADAEGKFIITAKSGDVLVITAQGMQTLEYSLGNASIVSISMKSSSATLEEVVVTGAFGIKRAARVTPFSTQVIKNDELTTIRQTNLNNSLAGKVAGVQFRGQSPIALNREGFLRIRGGQSLSDVGPIYVVDGTIVNSYDINPDDVADLTVLKGANATALFGDRAVNGAIVINTKKGGSKKGIGLEVNSNFTADRVYILPKYQNVYAGGANSDLTTFTWVPGMPDDWKALDGYGFPDYTDDASWGPKMEGQDYIPWYAWYPGTKYSFKPAKLVPQPDNARDFWQTGLTSNTNISFYKGGADHSIRMSYTNQSIKGLLPNSSSVRHNLFTTVSFDLNQHFTVAADLTFSNQQINGEFNDGYANQSSGSFNQWFHRQLDMGILKELKDLKSPVGTMATWNMQYNPDGYQPSDPWQFYTGNYWYNYYSYFQNVPRVNNRARLYGNASLTYKLNSHFQVRGTLRKNQLTTNYENFASSLLEYSAAQSGVLASYSTGQTTYNEYNYELLATYNQEFGNFSVNAHAGGNIVTTDYKSVAANTNTGLNVPDLYSITNSKTQPSIGNARQSTQTNSLFAQGEFGYKKFITASWAVRSDWYSTLPNGDNNLISPAAGLSFIFSEFTKNSLPWLSYGKLFGSWGKKPVSLGVYANNFTYGVNQFQWNGNFLMGTPNALIDPSLKGNTITTYEAGFEVRFVHNRVGVNLTYFNEDNTDNPLQIALSGVSGFTSKYVNAAVVKRSGIETMVTATPFDNKNFRWDLSATFSYLINNPISRLIEGTDRILLAGGAFGSRFARAYQQVGQDWGQLIGGGYARNSEGKILLKTNGQYVGDPEKHWGSVIPKVNGGLTQMFRYKNWNLGVNLSYQVGGKFFSLSEQWGTFSGLLDWTAAMNDRGHNVREDVSAGGGVHVTGVDATDQKTPVDMYVSAQSYFHQFYFNRVAEPFVHSLTYVKLGEVSLGYTIPVQKIGISKIVQGAVVSVIARNPWLIYREAKNFDPSEISAVQGEDGQFPGTRSLGVNLKVDF